MIYSLRLTEANLFDFSEQYRNFTGCRMSRDWTAVRYSARFYTLASHTRGKRDKNESHYQCIELFIHSQSATLSPEEKKKKSQYLYRFLFLRNKHLSFDACV